MSRSWPSKLPKLSTNPLSAYNSWFLANQNTVSKVEWLLASAVMFVSPSTAGTDELKTAWATTGLHFVRWYHDLVWLKHYSVHPKEEPLEKELQPVRPLANFPVKNINLAACLSLVENLSLLLELLCEFSFPSMPRETMDKLKFRVILLLELLKCAMSSSHNFLEPYYGFNCCGLVEEQC